MAKYVMDNSDGHVFRHMFEEMAKGKENFIKMCNDPDSGMTICHIGLLHDTLGLKVQLSRGYVTDCNFDEITGGIAPEKFFTPNFADHYDSRCKDII